MSGSKHFVPNWLSLDTVKQSSKTHKSEILHVTFHSRGYM